MTGTTLLLKGGSREMVFLGAGTASIDDLSTTTTVVAGSTSRSASILDFVEDSGFVPDLKNGVGVYYVFAKIFSALWGDGHGGIQLLLGSGAGAPRIDFVNTASSLLASAHFKIG